MELKINEVVIPEKITFNYEELKQELTEKVHIYETTVYTDDQIKAAKADKANLNKLKKALNDERIRREKEYMKPFDTFKAQVNEIIGIIDKPIAVIDRQVKEYEEKCRQEKLDKLVQFWNDIDHPQWLRFDMLMNDKWLNASVSMKSIQEEIAGRLEQINNDIATLSNLPEFSFEATEEYKNTLDINRAISEGKRLADIQKRKEEQERLRKEAEERAKAEAEAKKQAEMKAAETGEAVFNNAPDIKAQEPVQPQVQWINFSALLTVAQAVELKEFFVRRGIEFKAI